MDPLTRLEAARFGVYVHFPYCLSKCPYCDFASTVARVVPHEPYADAVVQELTLRAEHLGPRTVDSVFFGGGTPSLWEPTCVARVLEAIAQRFTLRHGAEITLEANPGAADAERFAAYRAAGINRLSMGVQSFRTQTLAALGRGHDGAMALRAYETARRAGFDSVSLDFIYGVQHQQLADVVADAEAAAALGPEHLSAYALTLDAQSLAEEVPLAKQLARGEVTLPPDELVVAMQRAVRDAFARAGLGRYEVSNYAKPGRHSRHNALYWTGGEYLGLGAGATGAVIGPTGWVRTTNLRSAEKYLRALADATLPTAADEALDDGARFRERLAMGLRLTSGVDVGEVCRAFGQDPAPRLAFARMLAAQGLGTLEGERLSLTDAGFDVHSAIAVKLL